jgi:hypothetical protein
MRPAIAGFRFPADVIVLAVRWYLRFGLSSRDLEELLTERGVEVDHLTIYRWVVRFTPLLAEAARPCRHRVGAVGADECDWLGLLVAQLPAARSPTTASARLDPRQADLSWSRRRCRRRPLHCCRPHP